MQDKLVAIIKGKFVGEVKNVDKNTFNELKNEQSNYEQEILKEKLDTNNKLDFLLGLTDKLKLLAKTIYDNFVDRGFIDNDNDFQTMWYNYYFNGGELDLTNAPSEYNTILEKVGATYEKE